MAKKRVRIKDIARAAGVSTGTVDRVIHNRGNVTPMVKKRVEQVMKDLNYQPNILASALANNKTLRIAALLPDYRNDLFWEAPKKGLEAAFAANQHFRIEMRHFFFDGKSETSFVAQSNKLMAYRPDALIIAPVFANKARSFLSRIAVQNLPYVLINTQLTSGGQLCYIGQDSFQTGVLAARLLSDDQPHGATFLILHLEEEEKTEKASHLLQKEAGFYAYFEKKARFYSINRQAFSEYGPEKGLPAFINQVLLQFPKPAGIFLTTSKVYQLIGLGGDQLKNTRIVGFDLLPRNIQYIKEGKIDYLINQNPEKQGYLALSALIDHLLLKKQVKPVQYLPIDIVVKENIDYYI